MSNLKAPTSLNDWVQAIKNEIPFVDKKPYSHNIINIALAAIGNDHGTMAANKVIEDLKLERLGWHKVHTL